MYMFTIFYIINSLKLSSIINLQKYEINQYGAEKVLLVADSFVNCNAIDSATIAAIPVDRETSIAPFSISSYQASGIVGTGIGEGVGPYIVAVDKCVLFAVGVTYHTAKLKFSCGVNRK